MKSKKVFCNKGIFLSDLRRFWWAPVLMTLLEFLVHPMELINAYYFNGYASDYLYNDLAVVHFVYPILIGALLFRYLHTSKSIQFFHTLPVTRGQLFRTKVLTFWMFLLIPVLVNWGAMYSILDTSTYKITYSEINTLYLSILCGYGAMCGFSLFVTTITGNTAGMILGTVILPFLPLGLFGVTAGLLDFTLIGYTAPDENFLTYLIPFMREEFMEYWWVPLTEFIVLHILATIFYRKYKAEATGDLITVSWLRPIFLYGVCYCSTVLGIAYADNYDFSLTGHLISAFIAAFIGFFIAESLLQRTVRIIGSWKKLLCYLLISFALILGLKFDLFGYESNIPELSEVESVQFSYTESLSPEYYHERGLGGAVLTEPENIQKVIDFHKTIAKKEAKYTYTGRYLIYQLKDGSKLKRYYNITNNMEIADILNTEEYKKKTYPIFDEKNRTLMSVAFYYCSTGEDDHIEILDKKIAKELEDAIKKDLLEQDESANEIIRITLRYIDDSNDGYYVITNGTHVKAWVEEYQKNTK